MLGFIKESILKQKQAAIKRIAPGVIINLHSEMPQPSMNKMVEVASLVYKINSFEQRISSHSDSELKGKTQEFKEHILKKSEGMIKELEELEAKMLESNTRRKREIKRKVKICPQ